MKESESFKRIVVKFGTQNLMNEGRLDQLIFDDVARQIDVLLSEGAEIVIVSSGAVQAGREHIKLLRNSLDEKFNLEYDKLVKKQISGIGMEYLMKRWKIAFKFYNHETVPLLFTHANLSNEGERESAKESILNYMKCKIVPVINENDVISDKEIKSSEKKISENDQLAMMVAELIGADAILFLTDVGGIFDKNPQEDLSARMYSVINISAPPPGLKISSSTSANGTGGMQAKFDQASECVRKGIYAVIGGLKVEDAILKFARQEPIGTLLADSGENVMY